MNESEDAWTGVHGWMQTIDKTNRWKMDKIMDTFFFSSPDELVLLDLACFTHQILQSVAHKFLLQSFHQHHLNRVSFILHLAVWAEPLRQNRPILKTQESGPRALLVSQLQVFLWVWERQVGGTCATDGSLQRSRSRQKLQWWQMTSGSI